ERLGDGADESHLGVPLFVAVVALSDDALAGDDARYHSAPLRHLVVASAENASQPGDKRHRLDRTDRQLRGSLDLDLGQDTAPLLRSRARTASVPAATIPTPAPGSIMRRSVGSADHSGGIPRAQRRAVARGR